MAAKKVVKDKKGGAANVAGAFLAGAVVAGIAGGYFLFGSKNAKNNRKKIEAWTLKAKAEVLDKIEKSKDITKDKFDGIVDGVMNNYKKLKHLTEDQVEGVRKELKTYWKHIESEVKKGSAKKGGNNK